jgi:hypothetical protein
MTFKVKEGIILDDLEFLTADRNVVNVTSVTIADRITHDGDTDTYLQFNTNNSFRTVIGGSQKLQITSDTLAVNSINTMSLTGAGTVNLVVTSTSGRAGIPLTHANTTQGALHTASTGLRIGYGAAWATNLAIQIKNNNGYVGIKNDNPQNPLDVTGVIQSSSKIKTPANIISGEGSGGVALTVNDGQGNANVTFNHENGIPEQDGNAARITFNSDSTTGATLAVQIKSNVTGGVSTSTTGIARFTEGGLILDTGNFQGNGSGLTNVNAETLDGLNSTDFQRLEFIDTQSKYLFRHRASANAVLYINQTAGGDIARFYKGANASDVTNTARRVTMTNDAQVVVDCPLTIGGGVTPENGHFIARTGSNFISIDPNEIYSNSEIIMVAETGNISFTASNGDIRFSNDTVFSSTNLNIAQRIRHLGDTDTLIEFPANNQWRVIVGNSQKLLIDTSAVRISNANLDLNNNRVVEVADPINNQDAVNLQYLDAQPYMKLVGNTLSGDANNANYWAKIATVNTGGANSDASIVIGFTTTAQSSGAAAQVHFHIRSNPSAVADDLQVEIQAASGLNFADQSFKITNTGGVVELWVRKITSFTAVNFYQMSASIPGGWSVVYEQNSPWIQNEPVGDVANVTSNGLQYRGNKVYHSGNDGNGSGLDADLLDGLGSSSFVRSDINDTVAGQIYFSNGGSPIINPRGTSAGYAVQANGGNTTNWGANIWALGENFDGTSNGDAYVRGNHYGLSWLRTTHPDEIASVGEGLYLDVAGTTFAAFGNGGGYLSQELYLSGITSRSIATDVGAGFGTLRLNGTGLNGYSGVSLEGEGVFMSNGTVVGIYDDINNGWIMRADYGGASRLFFDGAEKIVTQSGGILVSGQVSANDFNSTSDRSKKDNIETAKGLEVIEKLRGVEFDWKDSGKHSSGVIAQEVEEVIPHAVDNTGDHKTVNYNAMIAYLIEGMKEQQEMINSLKEEIEILKNN